MTGRTRTEGVGLQSRGREAKQPHFGLARLAASGADGVHAHLLLHLLDL